MTDSAKKQRNREYYLKNREKILTKAKARKKQRIRKYLEIVPSLKVDDPVCSADTVGISEASELSNPAAMVEKFQPFSVSALFLTGEAEHLTRSEEGSASLETTAPTEILPASEDGCKLGNSKVQMERKLKTAQELSEEHEISVKIRKKSGYEIASRMTHFFNHIPPSFMLRLLLVVGLTILMTAMQVAFYREHDILPGYAVPLALACEITFLSLVTMKCSRGLEWFRILIHLIFFAYFVAALSFHVYAKVRAKASSQPSLAMSEPAEIKDELKQAERLLALATKGRAWKNMEIFGSEVSRLRELLRDLPSAQVLGSTSDQILWMEAILLILLRVMLLAASLLNTLRLRDQVYEIAQLSGSTMGRKLAKLSSV